MKIVIQCAATKAPGAGYWRDRDGRRVNFIARPEKANCGEDMSFARPDDVGPDGQTFRAALEAYNTAEDNPFGLYEAWRLYEHSAYEQLVRQFGEEKVFILSAGWGLVRSTYRLPQYDITFSQAGGPLKKRGKRDPYCDFAQFAANECDEIHFVGGKSYISFFLALTQGASNRIIHYNSESPPSAPGCRLKRFQTTRRTNWHYDCAAALSEAGRR